MNYCEIKKNDIANGEGIRVTLFVSGCNHKCKGCFNEVAWDFNYGNLFEKSVEDELIEALSPNYVDGLTLLGGEPFEKQNQYGLIDFLIRVKETYPQKNIWAYTGFLFDKDLVKGGRAYTDVTDKMLSLIDVLVDGPFVEEKKNISLAFRGSENQRVLDVKKSLQKKEIVFYLN